MPTKRQELVAYLEEDEYTPYGLAREIGRGMKDVVYDLEHVRKSEGSRFRVRAAECRACGFVFRKREKVKPPSRCPVCRSERIDGPWLSIGVG